MNRFEYIRPNTVQEAIAASATPGTVFLAGGTNLLDLMKGGVMRPARVVDLARVSELGRIERLPDGDMRIGALVRNSDLANHETFATRYPAVTEALLSGASAQLRNVATTAGNLLQRTRCHYFYDIASACNKRQPGSGCGAVGGDARAHAVLGRSRHCVATHPSDLGVALVALDAIVEIHGRSGQREVPLEHFYRAPADTPQHETVLEFGELVVAVRLSVVAAGFAGRSRYLKVRDRSSYAFAVTSAAAGLRLEGSRIVEGRLALGGVALRPWRARTAEELLHDQEPSEALFQRVAEAALAEATLTDETAFKIELARRVIKRVLCAAVAGTPTTAPTLPTSVFTPPQQIPSNA